MSKAPSAQEQRELRALFGVPEGEKLGLDDWGWLRILASGCGEQLEEKGYFYLTAKELKELSGREPRLMAKHDFSTSRPWIFKELGLGILPVSRSEYFVGPLDLYERFSDPTHAGPSSVRTLDMPAGLDTLDIESVNSESMALNVASASGMLEHFLGCEPLQATVAGRMSSLEMTIPVPDLGLTVKVDRAQMEIDGGFESLEHLVLVEAKTTSPRTSISGNCIFRTGASSNGYPSPWCRSFWSTRMGFSTCTGTISAIPRIFAASRWSTTPATP